MARCFSQQVLSGLIAYVPNNVRCPSGLGCCAGGDTCLSNGICLGREPSSSGSHSSYYIASCADQTYSNPDCPTHCNVAGKSVIAYNHTSSEWFCCRKDSTNKAFCDKSTNETYPAPAPSDLTMLVRTSNSTDSQPSPTSQSSQLPFSPGSGGLSAVAKAGIGAGVSVGASIVILFLAWIYIQHRRKQIRMQSNHRESHLLQSMSIMEVGSLNGRQEKQGTSLYEKDSLPRKEIRKSSLRQIPELEAGTPLGARKLYPTRPQSRYELE